MWGPVIFGTTVSAFLLIVGALIGVGYRLGRLTQRVEDLSGRIERLEESSEQVRSRLR